MAATRLPAANATTTFGPKSRRTELCKLKTTVAIVATMAAAALAASTLGLTLLSDGVARAEATLLTHGLRLKEIQSKHDSLKGEVSIRLANMQTLLAEVKYPPSEFGQAQDLFRVGRYADAEAAYASFLLRNPNSRVADIALNNAAVTSSMRHNCTMAAAYVKRLKAQFPDSPFNAALATLVPSCQRLRAASLADTSARRRTGTVAQ